jgi:dephospho-CoA kinase
MPMKKIVIALVGMPGAGKSEAAAMFRARGCAVVRFGDVTEEELRRRGMPQTPETERKIREELREKEGMDAYASRNIPRIDAALRAGPVAADGLYSWAEFLRLRSHYGDRFRLVAIVASPAVRHGRLARRPVRPLTAAEAWARDAAEIEKIQKAGPIAMADHVLLNEGSIEDLRGAFEALWSKLERGGAPGGA